MLPRSITELCHNPEGWGPWSRRRTFDFTPCFLETVVVTIPWFLMAIVASVRIEELRNRSELASNLTKSRLYITKMSILGAMLGVTVYDFVYLLIHQSSVVVTSSNLSDIFLITAMIVAIILQHYEHTRNRIPSSIFLLFWPVALMADVIQIRSWILRDISHKEDTRFWLLLVRTTCSLLAFIVEFIRKPVLDYQSIGDHQDLSIEEKSNIYSYLTFQWMSPILALGYQRPLVMNDLWPVSSKHRTRYVSSLFDNCWNYYLNRGQPSLVKTLVYSFGSKMLVSGDFLYQVIRSFYYTRNTLTCIKGSMFLATLIQTCFLHQYFQLSQVTGMNVRTAMSTAIYRKALRLSNASRQKYTTGEIVNMMSVDAQRCESLCNFLHLLWSSPFQIILALAMLYRTLGWSALAVATYLRSLQLQQMKNKDQRTKLMDEILSGIKVIKLYAWEIPFFKKIRAIRNDRELKTLKKYGIGVASLSFITGLGSILVSLATFGVYALLDGKSHGPLDASLIFVSLSLFNLLGFPLSAFPQVITFVIEASVSVTRVFNYLTSEELDITATGELIMRDASFAWDGTDESQTISNVSFSLVGRVGSGKSSLISALLGDMAKLHGEVELKGTVAYAAQQPWIMNATLRENILFGHAYDPDFYQKTIEACALTQDFEMLPGGDQTEIGEKGINLSGGQKARVSLASCLCMADIYLLDDTLSAVDSHVGRHIFNHVIGPKGLLKNRARIFVTHALQYVHDADQVMMLRDGRVVEFDSFDALMEQQGELEEEEALDAEAEAEAEIELNSESLKEALSRSVGGHSAHSDVDAEIPRRPLRKTITHETLKSLRRTSMASVDSEDGVMRQGNGRVSLDVYAAYFKSCSIKNVILYGLLGLATQSGTIASSIWLKRWSEYNQEHPNNDDASFYLISYAIIGITTVMIYGVNRLFYMHYAFIGKLIESKSNSEFTNTMDRSAKVTHESMLLGVVRSPMSFFDTTPLGRILNRFSKDQTTIDENIPRTIAGFVRTLLQVFGVLGIIAYSSPGFIVVIIPLTFIYVYVQRYYLESSRELKRLDSVSRSPVFAHFQETLGGASTIRAYRQTKRFAQESRWRIDENLKAYYLWVSLNRWLAVRLEFVGSIVILSASMLAVVTTVTTGNTNASLVGLAVTNALYITQSLNWCVRMFCEIETNIVSMERLQEYAELPSEAPEIIEGRRPSHFWPERGVIKFTDYQTRYREGLELVLKGVSFDVKSREKIGIVGRTGAGKSSLTLSLFRLIEAAAGSITIDGVDISQIGLYDLRSRLTIIPQDPVLFAGSVRDNLDPFETHEDIEIWNVLNSAHLKDHISSLEGKLNAPVIQGGENFSVGQRQLICLARALLRRSSILVLDEATAAIDVETDKAIQETIRREFKNCTILTIAHR
ncbi:hypothetical protein BDF19DRAFT_433612 [Syncephalis fuscata]|nr:hypothetical protein BDF19DRAFT_433612 [Syncephalis fuscata]